MRKSTDIGENAPKVGKTECILCDEAGVAEAVATRGSAFAVDDLYPVTVGHLLDMPRRHTTDFFSMTRDEIADAMALIEELGRELRESDPTVAGFNIG